MQPRILLTIPSTLILVCFFFNDTATTEIYTLSLHDALPICLECQRPAPTRRGSRSIASKPRGSASRLLGRPSARYDPRCGRDRKSTRLNSSHSQISYAVFCLKKKSGSPSVVGAGRGRTGRAD